MIIWNLLLWKCLAHGVLSLAGDETFSYQHELTSLSVPDNSDMMPLAIVDQSVFLERQEGILDVWEE